MGVEHYVVCDTCKEYIDIHKNYQFSFLTNTNRPPIGNEDDSILNSYWTSRAIWFMWNHRGHSVELWADSDDDWFDKEPYLKEVFNHNDDLKLRKNK